MPDLSEQIRAYIDDAAPALTIEDVQASSDPEPSAPSTGSTPRRWRVLVAAAACVAVLAGVVAVVRSRPAEDTVAAGPGTTTVDPWAWLDQFGTEGPAPAVPAGWQTIDVGDLRMSIPADWTVPISPSCLRDTNGAVVVHRADDQTTCGGTPPDPASRIDIARGDPPAGDGRPVRLGTLDAVVHQTDPCPIVGCPAIYMLPTGEVINVHGPDTDTALSTLTDSGERRVLQRGTAADTTTWTAIDYQGVTVRVPPDWQRSDAGYCGNSPFPSVLPPKVVVGDPTNNVMCPFQSVLDLHPSPGIWIRGVTEQQANALGSPIARGRVDDLDVSVLDLSPMGTGNRGFPALDLLVRTPNGIVWVTLGVGLDTTIPRAVLRSISTNSALVPSGPQAIAPSSTTTPPSAVPWTAPTGTDVLPGCPAELRQRDPAPFAAVAAALPEPVRATYQQTVASVANCNYFENTATGGPPPMPGGTTPPLPAPRDAHSFYFELDKVALNALATPPTRPPDGTYRWGTSPGPSAAPWQCSFSIQINPDGTHQGGAFSAC